MTIEFRSSSTHFVTSVSGVAETQASHCIGGRREWAV